jgi:DNA polymerase I-like protein with 3'-5' exonuclease and polymerase domains
MLTAHEGSSIDWENIDLKTCAYGNVLDTRYTLEIYKILDSQLKGKKVETFLEKVINKLHIVLAKASFRGIDVSDTVLNDLEKQINEKVMDVEDLIYASKRVKNKSMKLTSTKDLREILFMEPKENNDFDLRDSGFNFFWSDETDNGNPSTDREALTFLLNSINEELLSRGESG